MMAVRLAPRKVFDDRLTHGTTRPIMARMSGQPSVLKDYMTVSEAQAELGVARSTFYRLIEKFGVRPLKAGWSALFKRSDIERMKQARKKPGA